MAHLLRSILFPSEGDPNHLAAPPSKVASFSASNHGRPRRCEGAQASAREGDLLQGFRPRYNNPEVIFTQDPEIEEPAASRFVADSILGGFDLNQQYEDNCGVDATVNENAEFVPEPGSSSFVPGPESATFVPGPESAASGNAAEEAADEISSQPAVPYVGMEFDDLEEAYKVYNDYAYKTGFGIRIGNTKYSTARNVPKDTILNRVFECVHTGKTSAATQGNRNRKDSAANMMDSPVDMSSFTAEKQSKNKGLQMDLSDTRQRNRLLRYDCKAHMHVGKRNGRWTVTVFTEDHTHPMVKQLGRRRYYRSHRKVPEEDFQLLQTLHNQNISTAQIMGCLGNVRGGDLRTLGYVKRDVSNIRTMLRNDVSLRDMSLTIEYFEKRKAESPSFFYATQLDENNAQYELCQNLMLDREDNAGFTMETTGRPLWGRKMNNLASDACYAEDTYAIVSSMVDEASKIVNNMRRARNGMQQQQEDMQPEQHEAGHKGNEAAVDEAQGSGNLRNPPRNKPKGHPKETEKRHKPLIELREEANKKDRRRRVNPRPRRNLQ
ncbi:hypothetical protein QYE76_055705 [Lolium multiflorum]|uniref:Protein FAR1-RELATED SEQUENCE n=1 Tax=Lolium multiflorum TaxID=4521 RepID=A0AAD8T072_LOLMU|nr:hypothetical protein QYE76_055705 [Lolium multiflorum]